MDQAYLFAETGHVAKFDVFVTPDQIGQVRQLYGFFVTSLGQIAQKRLNQLAVFSNQGAFHLATSLGAPIVPIYFAIPRAMDPGMGYDAKPGALDVYFLPPIDTTGWCVADVERHRDEVRELYVRVHDSMRRTGFLPVLTAIEEDAPLMQEALA